MLHTIYSQASLAVVLAVTLFAFAFGGGRERAGAALVAVGAGASALTQPLSHSLTPVVPLMMIDAAMLGGFLTLSWRSMSIWPVVATALQGIAVAVHLIRLLTPTLPPSTYLTTLGVTSYGVLGVLALGAVQARRAGRATGRGLLS